MQTDEGPVAQTTHPSAPLPDAAAVLGRSDRELMARTAWLYYVEGLTQAEIADRLRLSRIKVQRLLAAGRRTGMVQIRIHHPVAECVRLERALEAKYGLKRAVVAPLGEGQHAKAVASYAAAAFLSDLLQDNMTLAIGWGTTLAQTVSYLSPRRIPGLTVVSLLGGLTKSGSTNPYEVAWKVADLFQATCYYIPAPFVVDSPAVRASMLSQPSVAKVLSVAERADVALLGVGDLGPTSTIVRIGLLQEEEVAELKAHGAVGDVIGHFLDREGRLVPSPINDRTIGLSLESLSRIPWVIAVAAGQEKLEAVLAALEARVFNVLVTDEHLARTAVERGEKGLRRQAGGGHRVQVQLDAAASRAPQASRIGARGIGSDTRTRNREVRE